MEPRYPLTSPLLLQVHATTIHLYLKTWMAHWNVIGRDFFQLHGLFERQYDELAAAVDRIGEHLRVLGLKAPGAMGLLLQMSVIDDTQLNGSAQEMLEILLLDNSRLIELLDRTIAAATQENLQATLNILQDRVELHGSNVWMLRTSLM